MRPTRLSPRLGFAVLGTLLLVAPGVVAQVVNAGDYVTCDYTNKVFRVTPAGAVSLLHQGAPLAGPSGCTATLDREVIIADYNGNQLFRMTSSGALVPIASVTNPIRVAMDHNGDMIVTCLPASPQLRRVTPAGTVTPIASGSALAGAFGLAVDLDGNYIVTNQTARTLLRITPAGVITTIASGPPFQLPQGVAVLFNGDYAVMDGLTDTVYRVPRAGGAVTVLLSGAIPGGVFGNPDGIHADFQGGVVVSESGTPTPGSNRVVQIDSAGAVTVIAQGAPFLNLEGVCRVPFLSAPTQPTTGPGSTYSLGISLPGEGGLAYTIAAALTTFPGTPLPPPDARGLPLNPDELFFLTLLTDVPPYTTNWNGILSAGGTGTGSLDLSALVPGQFAGLRLYLQAASLDFQAPNYIRTLSNPVALVFQ